jgi:hypothetical protein
MTSNQVFISQRAALVKGYLARDVADRFVAVVSLHTNPANIEQPYRDWFFDVTTIPEESRARYIDANTGEIVVRSIPANV